MPRGEDKEFREPNPGASLLLRRETPREKRRGHSFCSTALAGSNSRDRVCSLLPLLLLFPFWLWSSLLSLRKSAMLPLDAGWSYGSVR